MTFEALLATKESERISTNLRLNYYSALLSWLRQALKREKWRRFLKAWKAPLRPFPKRRSMKR